MFFAMFYRDLAETTDTIELSDCDSEGFLELLRYMFCDEAELTGSNVMQVLYLAKKFMVPVAEARPSLLRVSRLFDHVTWLTESVSSVVLLMICDTRNPSFRMKADKGQYFCFISQCACFYT